MFGSRIVSRSDVGDLGANVKSLKRVFPDGGRMSVILDDREDVWANAKDNDRLFTGGRKGEVRFDTGLGAFSFYVVNTILTSSFVS